MEPILGLVVIMAVILGCNLGGDLNCRIEIKEMTDLPLFYLFLYQWSPGLGFDMLSITFESKS